MRPGLQSVMRAAVERLRREGKHFDLFDLGDISDLLDALDDCPYCERMLAAEARVETLEAALHGLLRNIGGHNHWREGGAGGVCQVCEVQSAAVTRAYAALSSEDATRPTGDKE